MHIIYIHAFIRSYIHGMHSYIREARPPYCARVVDIGVQYIFAFKPLRAAILNKNFLSSRDVFYGLESVYVHVYLLCMIACAYIYIYIYMYYVCMYICILGNPRNR